MRLYESLSLHLGSPSVYSDGTFYTPTGGVSSSSDIRLKTNILPIEDGLSKVMELNPVIYDWRNPTLHGGTKSSGGFIAQEISKTFPNMVSKGVCRGDDCKLVDKDGQELDVTYGPVFFANLVRAIQQLKSQFDDLIRGRDSNTREIASLKVQIEKERTEKEKVIDAILQQNAELKARMERLEKAAKDK